MMLPFEGGTLHALVRYRSDGYYGDNFGSRGISDYIKYAEYDEPEEPTCGSFPADTPVFSRYTRRQAHIIKGTLPSFKNAISKLDLLNILDRAYEFEDELVINIIFEKYKDMLEDVLDEPEISDEDFDALLNSFATFKNK